MCQRLLHFIIQDMFNVTGFGRHVTLVTFGILSLIHDDPFKVAGSNLTLIMLSSNDGLPVFSNVELQA